MRGKVNYRSKAAYGSIILTTSDEDGISDRPNVKVNCAFSRTSCREALQSNV
jgi:hypothetical protein